MRLRLSRRGRDAWRRLGAISVAFLMVACASQDTRVTAESDLSLADRLFSTGYQDIADIYIDEVTAANLALAGLGNLSSLYPDVSVTQSGDWVTLSVDGRPAGSFTAPDGLDAEGWGELTASALRIGRGRSPEMSGAEPEEIYEVVFDGVLGELDSFSRYAGRDEARENRASRDGFGGIGVRIRLIDQGVRILSVMENTPAERSGLQDNDIIVEIDGMPTVGLSQREVVRRLRGPLRSRVELTVERETQPAALDIAVVRAHIVPQTVKYERQGNLAVIRISGFNQSTTRSLREKLELAKDEIGPALAGFVLDLRGNPGGLLDQAVAVSDLFIGAGRIVSTHGRHPDSHQYFDADADDLAKDRPVVVLVNGNSASASEIVAAALQDSGRAVVIGSGSFGKGTVQTVLRLPNEGELTLTWARFHAPSGYALNGRGVLPDICTTGDDLSAEDVLERLREGTLPFDRTTQRRDIDPDDTAAIKAFRAMCPARQSDPQLDIEVARRLIEDPVLFARALGAGTPDTASLETGQSAVAPISQ
ncbi:MAG: S41 family peptidase [Proteobacteria bacterium]|nr:S41 family peptidase [Pseudomonadota bacterium]